MCCIMVMFKLLISSWLLFKVKLVFGTNIFFRNVAINLLRFAAGVPHVDSIGLIGLSFLWILSWQCIWGVLGFILYRSAVIGFEQGFVFVDYLFKLSGNMNWFGFYQSFNAFVMKSKVFSMYSVHHNQTCSGTNNV